MSNIFDALKYVWFHIREDHRAFILSMESKNKLSGSEKAMLTVALFDAEHKRRNQSPSAHDDFWDEYL